MTERDKERTEPAEGILRSPFARGEADAEKDARPLKVLKTSDGATKGRDTRLKLLAGGLTAAVLLTVAGGGVALAQDESTNSGGMCPMMQGGGMGSMMGGSGMSSMHSGSGGMGSMHSGDSSGSSGGMGSMMGGNHEHGTSESTSAGS